MIKGSHHSEETKVRLCIVRLGKKPNLGHYHTSRWKAETSERMIGNKNGLGYHMTSKQKEKLCERLKGNKYALGYHHMPEAKGKQRIANLGNKNALGYCWTPEQKANISAKMIGNENGLGSRWSLTPEQIARMSGPNHPNWQGGISFEPYGLEFNNILKSQIRDRDNHRCQKCFVPENGRAHDVHHIDYNKKNNSPENLIILCLSDHRQTYFRRLYWTGYYQKFQSLRGIN